MNVIKQIVGQHKLWIVEDAACGFGDLYHHQHVGTFDDTGCLSFHPRKSITTGEVGIITSSDDELSAKMRSMRNHCTDVSD